MSENMTSTSSKSDDESKTLPLKPVGLLRVATMSDDGEGEDSVRGSFSSDASSKPDIKMKTLGSVAGAAMRTPQQSFAEEHKNDISAEINALATISATDEVEVLARFVLHHESTEKLGWDMVMVFLIVFSSFANPLQIGFDIATSGGVLVAEIMIDFIFMIDVGLNFRTTAVDEATKETITDVRQISKRYLKGWFVLDVLGSLPVALVSHAVEVESVKKYFLALKLLRTLKLHRLSAITTEVLKHFEDKDFNPAVFRIYVFVLAFLLVLHFIACGYWAVSRYSDPDFEGNWTPEDYYLDDSLHLQYARAIYFALVINSGNDMKPDNYPEYLFSIVCLTLALGTNAIIIGSATNLLSNVDAGAVAKRAQMDGINGYMRFRKVPPGLQRKIRTFYEYLWDSGQDKHSTGLFEEMPEKLKLQLNVALKKRLIEKVPLFKTCSPAGTIALVQNLFPSIILPGELIIQQGEPATSMFFISRGTVRVFVVPDGEGGDGMPLEEKYIISLSDGSFFGEVALLKEKHVRTANIRAETFTELQVMLGEDFRALAEVFPEFKAAVDEISKSRVNASDALIKMQTRGKFGGADKSSVRSAARESKTSIFKRATQNAMADGKSGDFIPKLKLLTDKARQASKKHLPTGYLGAQQNSRGLTASSSRFSTRGRGSIMSFGASPRGSLIPQSRTVYEMVVAHEENMSHETAMRVAKGGGIRKQTLVDMENVESLVRGPVVDRSMARRPTRAFAAVGKGPGSR